jgi:1-acyl-sn-glycerol-3-phosphate acyltransferase
VDAVTLYWIARGIIHGISRVLWRVRARGAEQSPRSGALIVAANHRSYLDPPILGAFFPRQVSYMAKSELFDIPIFGTLIAAVGAYPVSRNGSARAAIKRSLEVLKSGRTIGIFPEGTRNPDGSAQLRQGVALLASLADCPVVPAALVGTADAMRLRQIKVAYGAPMRLPEGRKATRDDLAKFTDDVMSAIRALAESIGGDS